MDTETTQGQDAPFACPRCTGQHYEAQPAGWVCRRCGRIVHYQGPTPWNPNAEVERQEAEQLRRLEREYPPAGGSLKADPLLRPHPIRPEQVATAAALELSVNDLTDTAARLGAGLEAGLANAETVGKALAELYRQLGRTAGFAEGLYGAGELGGWVLGALADHEGQG